MTTTEEKTQPVTDLFEQTMKNYEQALKTGVKMQEESMKYLSNLVSQNGSPQDWQKRMKTMTDGFIPQTQKTVDEGLKLIEQTNRTGVELLKKVVASGQPNSVQDAQVKCLGVWEASLDAMRDTAVSMTQASNKAIEAWFAYAWKSGEQASTEATA